MIENFSKNLIRLRKENEMTQQELAEKLELSKQTISTIEKGNSYPTFHNLEKISRLFSANAIDLFGDEKERDFFNADRVMNRIDERYRDIRDILEAGSILDNIKHDEDLKNILLSLDNINQNSLQALYDLYYDKELLQLLYSIIPALDTIHNFFTTQTTKIKYEKIGGYEIESYEIPSQKPYIKFNELPFEKIKETADNLKFIKENKDLLEE